MMEQRTDAWFEARRGKITASVIGGILGVSPYMTADDVAKRLVAGMCPDLAHEAFAGNIATRWGQDHEDVANSYFQAETGLMTYRIGFLDHPSFPWLGASPDGFVLEGGGKIPIELKCPYNKKLFRMADRLDYWHQVQCQISVMDAPHAYFAVWTPDGFHVEQVARDEAWEATTIPTLLNFLESIQAIAADPERAQRLLANDATVRDDRLFETLTHDYLEAKQAADAAEAALKAKREALINACGGISSTGFGLMVKQTAPKKIIDYKQACEAHGIDTAPYAKLQSATWMIKKCKPVKSLAV
jgi:putative phage-type endonuclease